MNDKEKLALMYDFYNAHTLKGQNDDIKYYINQINNYMSKEVLVVGAGTGRVAIPLTEYANITALDFDRYRLELLKTKNKSIATVYEDFLNYKSKQQFDLIIIPYSTLQFDNNEEKLNAFFESLYNNMNSNTISIFDISESFNSKIEKNRELIFKDYCKELNDEIEVYYSAKRYREYIEFFIEYSLCKEKDSVIENERYYYYNKELISKLMNNNNLLLFKIDDGYGKEEFKHKNLYHCRRKK